jgi:hypothetical protein
MYVGIVRTLNHVGETYMEKLKRAYVAVGTYKNKIRKRKKRQVPQDGGTAVQ